MKSKFLTASVLASALFAGLGMSPAMAQGTNTPRIDQAQQAIIARIQQGMASGHITPSEAQMLYRREREISVRESQYKANGNATPPERAQLRADLDALSAEVERMMANRDVVRPGNAGNAGNTPGIDNREYQISQRIDEGVRSGRINQREARRLQRREREIARQEAQFKSDGVVTQQERRQLRNELTALSQEVERLMRNERRGGRNY
jgi:signal transduction histidine kinase